MGGGCPRLQGAPGPRYKSDDGQEIAQLVFSPEGARLVDARGGDHDANWEADVAPVPDATAAFLARRPGR